MLNAGFQYLEQRDANDTITKDGVVGKNSPFATSDNSGIYDIIAEDLRWLKENIDDVKDTSDLLAIKQSVTDMYNTMKNDSSFGEVTAKAQAEEAKKQAQAALESATNAKTYYDDITNKSTEVNDTIAEIKTYIEKAETLNASNKELEQSIADHATVATNKANEASTSATKAATSETNAKASETNTKASENKAKASETNAATSASNAATSESHAKTSETNAAKYASSAATSESSASASKSNAATSESNAKSYMDTAKEYMQKAQEALAAAQAIQSIVDTAKANAEKCLADVEAVKESLAKMITYQGSVDNYSDLPTNPQVGYSYNVKNADKTHGVNAGDNLVWNGDSWDNFGSYVDMSLFAELGKDARFNSVTATTFTGHLVGNADRATASTNDGNGANIASTYVKKAGDTTTGKITFASTDLNALPEVKKTSDDNMSGVRFSSKTKFLGAVGKRLSNGEDLLNLRSDNNSTDVVLDSRNYNNYAPTKTGGGASGTWGINISGNAATATKATQDTNGRAFTDTNAYMHISALADNTDFNNVKTTGIYYCTGNTYSNRPHNSWGILTVYSIGTVKQEYRPDDAAVYYTREYNNTNWTEWSKVNAASADTATNANHASTADKFSKTGNELGALLWDMFHRYGTNYVPSDTSNRGWNSLGLCIIYYAKNLINHQPTQWGQLINLPADLGVESTQIWISQTDGVIYTRVGNGDYPINDKEFTKRG